MRSTLLSALSLFGLACGSEGTGPRPPDGDGARMATEFERLADSVESGGYSPAAEALRHAAVIVRLTGHATPVTVWIDGRDRSFVAVAEQIDFPNLVCSWPSDSGAPPPPDTVSVPLPDSGGIPPSRRTRWTHRPYLGTARLHRRSTAAVGCIRFRSVIRRAPGPCAR